MDKLDLNKLKLKGNTICDCGHEFTINDMTKLIRNEDVHYYGGRVKFYSETICPHCRKKVVLMLENYNNSFRVIDIAFKKIKNEDMIKNNTEDVIKTENTVICRKCGKIFKSVAGLKSHQRKCLS